MILPKRCGPIGRWRGCRLTTIGRRRDARGFLRSQGVSGAARACSRAWPKMRHDLDVLAAPLMDVDRVGKSHERVGAEITQRVEAGEPFGWVRGWGRAGGNPDWTQYGLVLGDRAVGYASAPRTLALLAPLRGIKVAAFVRLAPGTLLPLHTHPEVAAEGLLQMHVTLRRRSPRRLASSTSPARSDSTSRAAPSCLTARCPIGR